MKTITKVVLAVLLGILFVTEAHATYYGMRWYNPQVGRWLSRDPVNEVGFELGFRKPRRSFRIPRESDNQYAFLKNSGINDIDLLGLSGCCKCGEDVSDLINRTKLDIQNTFYSASIWRKALANASMFSPMGIGSWDITWLKQSTFKGSTLGGCNCGDTVTYNGHCVSRDELNYMMFGWAVNLCAEDAEFDIEIALRTALFWRSTLPNSGDTPDSVDRKIAFAELGVGWRYLGNDMNWPSHCDLNTKKAQDNPSSWRWDGLK